MALARSARRDFARGSPAHAQRPAILRGVLEPVVRRGADALHRAGHRRVRIQAAVERHSRDRCGAIRAARRTSCLQSFARRLAKPTTRAGRDARCSTGSRCPARSSSRTHRERSCSRRSCWRRRATGRDTVSSGRTTGGLGGRRDRVEGMDPVQHDADGRNRPTAGYGAHWWLKLNPEIGGSDPAAAAHRRRMHSSRSDTKGRRSL